MSPLLILLVALLVLFSPSSSSRHVSDAPTPAAHVRNACTATRFPDACVSSLSQPGLLPPAPKPFQIVRSAVSVSYKTLKTGRSMVKSILDSSAGNKNLTDAANTCVEMLSYSDHRTRSTDEALTRNEIKDARAWMSAALSYQYDCWSGLKYFNLTKDVSKTASLLQTLISYSSNALSMMMSYDNFGNDVTLWAPPLTERNGFWDRTGSGAGNSPNRKTTFGFPSDLTANVTVCKDGAGGCYKTVQDGVNAAPDNGERRFVIRIKKGVYEETVRVPFEKTNVVFIGDGRGKTVITGSLNVGQPGMTTYASATVGVLGDGFMARDLTIQNTAGGGENAHQAVAFRSDSDLSILEKCEFLGNQDTLYAHSLRQLYKSCRIQGNVDFVFGNAAAVFQDCEILIAPRPPGKGETNVVSAQARTDPSQTTGFVFVRCLINGTEDYIKGYRANPAAHRNYLGRPWKEYSRTVFVGCKMEELISPEGWMPWTGDFALKTLFYGESKNSGPGAGTSRRVPWSSLIPEKHMELYSAENFIQADEWATTSS